METVCAFFGHRDTPMSSDLEKKLYKAVEGLVLGTEKIRDFWLCEQGTFDCLTHIVMQNILRDYRWVWCTFVLAYEPSQSKEAWMEACDYMWIYPDTLYKVPKRIAIIKRNEYIADNADYIICYINKKEGSAYKAVLRAYKRGAKIINLVEDDTVDFSAC